jgi:hypothetical protein
LKYLCEVCGKEEELTEKEAYEAGWDYPPFIGQWGVVSPRTCGDCGIEKTAYWAVITDQVPTVAQLVTIERIIHETPPKPGEQEVREQITSLLEDIGARVRAERNLSE